LAEIGFFSGASRANRGDGEVIVDLFWHYTEGGDAAGLMNRDGVSGELMAEGGEVEGVHFRHFRGRHGGERLVINEASRFEVAGIGPLYGWEITGGDADQSEVCG